MGRTTMNMTHGVNKNYAPIVLIGFNRPQHLKKTISALATNIGASNSNLYCYIDGARSHDDNDSQKAIVEIINDHLSDFKKVSIIHRKANFGLAKNIIEAVTEVVSKYGKDIVLEDDIVTS